MTEDEKVFWDRAFVKDRFQGEGSLVSTDAKRQSGFPKGDRGGPGSMSAAEDDTTRQRELAVLNIAEKYKKAREYGIPGEQGRYDGKSEEWWRAELFKHLDALTALQSVDPQTLRPGQRFRFTTPTRADVQKEHIFRAVWVIDSERGDRLGWESVGARICSFLAHDRVIPLPEEAE